MSRVRCAICVNEVNSVCLTKKVKVRLNKPRLCAEYELQEYKVKEKQPIHTVREGYVEVGQRKREAKEKLKEHKRLLKVIEEKNKNEKSNRYMTDRVVKFDKNSKHPMTGDLSRFKTTADR